jgi:hypothetical protein
MLKFKALDIDDKDLFDSYLKEYPFNTYEYSFTTLYFWRKYCNIEYTILNGALIIKKHLNLLGTYFMQPIGYTKESLSEIIGELKNYQKSSVDMPYLFREVEEKFLEDMQSIYKDTLHIEEDEDNFDYIYDSKALATLSGNKLHSKKNHYNHFIKHFEYEIKSIKEDEVASDCINFEYEWACERKGESKELCFEYQGIKDTLKHADKLGVEGLAVYVDNKMAGFTIGEKVNDDMAIIHVEKGKKEYNGIYAFINKTFVEEYFMDVKFINREEDLGIEGLRTAKMSYHPVKLEKKYLININE